MNQLTLDLTQPDLAKALENCETGEHVQLSVGGTLTKDGDKATVDVDSVDYTGGDGEGSPEEEAKESPADEAKEDAEGKGDAPAPSGKKLPHAVTIMFGQPK